MTKVYITESGYKLNVASTLRMTASEAETLLDGVFEPALGNPDANGYVLSSTAAGVRSWVEGGGGASDVDDLATSTGSSTNMLRVAAAGGLEYRTTAQVLGDIGAAPTASPTFSGTVTAPTIVGGVIKPASNSTTALQLTNAAGAAVLTVDTTNTSVNINGATGTDRLAVNGTIAVENAGLVMKFLPDGIYSPAGGALKYWNGSAVVAALYWTQGKIRVGDDSVPTAYADIAASTTAAASLRIRSGTAPTTPNDGDIWYDGSNLKIRIGATTYNVDVTAA